MPILLRKREVADLIQFIKHLASGFGCSTRDPELGISTYHPVSSIGSSTRNSKPQTRNSSFGCSTRNPKLRNPKPETRNPKPGIWFLVLGSWNFPNNTPSTCKHYTLQPPSESPTSLQGIQLTEAKHSEYSTPHPQALKSCQQAR